MPKAPSDRELRRTIRERAEGPPKLRDWEKKLAINVMMQWAEFGGAVSRKGIYIRTYFQKEGPAYGYQMFKDYEKFVSHPVFTETTERPPRPGSYQAFGNYMWWLQKLGLIKLDREEPGTRGLPRRYYKAVRSKLKSEDWQNPRWALYAGESGE